MEECVCRSPLLLVVALNLLDAEVPLNFEDQLGAVQIIPCGRHLSTAAPTRELKLKFLSLLRDQNKSKIITQIHCHNHKNSL